MYLDLVWAALCDLLYFALHVTCSGTFPKPLTLRQERECLERIRNGDSGAKNTLIEHNLRLVAHIVKKYYAISGEQEDLISIGTIGLIKAASTFDYNKSNKFSTYASKCIENVVTSPMSLYRLRFGKFLKLPINGGCYRSRFRGFMSSAGGSGKRFGWRRFVCGGFGCSGWAGLTRGRYGGLWRGILGMRMLARFPTGCGGFGIRRG